MLNNILISKLFHTQLATQHEGELQEPMHSTDEAGQAGQATNKYLAALAHHLHYCTFLPLVIVSVLASINLPLAGGLCVAVVAVSMLLSFLLFRAGYIRVFPKKYDIFNLQLYVTITIIASVAQRWLHIWLSFYINVSNAIFMWSSLLVPCFDPFVMDNVRDSLPPPMARHPLVQSMAIYVSVVWAVALTIMAAAQLVPAVTIAVARSHQQPLPEWFRLMFILCSLVFGIAPTFIAILVQTIIIHVYKRRIKQAVGQHVQSQTLPETPHAHQCADDAKASNGATAAGPEAV